MNTPSTERNTMNPNKEHIKQWVAALRSGKYRQGRSQLAYAGSDRETQYCCLGVACDLAGINPDGDGRIWTFDGEDQFLPEAAMVWLGLDTKDPTVNHLASVYNDEEIEEAEEGDELTTLNDSGTSFEEIAELIESTYLN